MMKEELLKKVLKKGKPLPSNVPWYGSPNLGGYYGKKELDAIVDVIKESSDFMVGFWSSSDEITMFEEKLAAYCGVKYCVALVNCGAALDLTLRALKLESGDEVICPAVNYKASHMAILDRGATVVFCDIDPVTFNVDLNDLNNKITERTRALIPVSLTGLPLPIDKLEEIVSNYSHLKNGPPKIIVDAARSLGGMYKGEKVGTSGWATCFSFQSQKLITTLGEGGALVTNDHSLAKKVREMSFYGGEKGWGMNYRMNKVQAAVGSVQLDRIDEMITKRRIAVKRRNNLLKGITNLTLPSEPDKYFHSYYVYPIIVKPEWAGEKRDKIIEILDEEYGIICSITNKPVYSRWPYISEECGIPDLPVSESIGKRLFCPPLHPYLNEDQENYISASIISAVNSLK